MEKRTEPYTQIIIISPNATLDLIYSKIEHGFSSKDFFRNFSMRPGGSGINVARALAGMGISSTVYTVLGGNSGDIAERELYKEGIRACIIRGDEETRTTAIQYRSGTKTMAVSPTPRFTQNQIKCLINASKNDLDKAAIVFYGGSFTDNPVIQDIFVSFLRQYKSRLIIDTRGGILNKLLTFPPICAKVDMSDRSSDLSIDLYDEDRIISHCTSVYSQGVSLACTEGISQIYAMFQKKIHFFPQFDDPVSRPYGRGDAFMAGVLLGFLKNVNFDNIVRLGILAGNCCGPVMNGLGSLDADRFTREKNEFL